MYMTYGWLANAALYQVSQTNPGQVKKEYHCDFKKLGGIINLDFDSDGGPLGIEVLDASLFLTKERWMR